MFASFLVLVASGLTALAANAPVVQPPASRIIIDPGTPATLNPRPTLQPVDPVFSYPPPVTVRPTTTSSSTKTSSYSTSKFTGNPTLILNQPRVTNMLATIKGQYSLPDPGPVQNNGTLNATDIQGDILVGMKKKLELFYFFSINNPASYKAKFKSTLLSRVTTTLQLLSTSTQPQTALNVAYSSSGLAKLGQATDLGDGPFGRGQFFDSFNLGDVTSNWMPPFVGSFIHGVFLIASDDQFLIDAMVALIENTMGTDITRAYTLKGNIRPPPFDGHEMFGYLDGVGQPAVAGFNLSPVPGQDVIPPGVILTGHPGDPIASSRPSWSKNGSFLVFRQLKQLVPEWDNFVVNTASSLGMDPNLLGARMIGRWKSGAPVDLRPTADDPSMAVDPNQNNNFNYAHAGFPLNSDQTHCPFSAHTRKTRPRADQPAPGNAIMRSGIPYGPEVSTAERQVGTSSTAISSERGLAFVAYQSVISNGFQFMQTQWVNNQGFPFGKTPAQSGFDPVVGQNQGSSRLVRGLNPANPNQAITIPQDFVVSRGGEYFFSPSLAALGGILST